jgi:anti-sigma B factor antagonist
MAETRAEPEDIAVRLEPDGRRLVVAGELDLATGAVLTAAVTDLVGGPLPCELLLLDVSGVTFADVAGLRALAGVVRLLATHGCSTHVVGVRAAIRRAVDLAGFDDLADALDHSA